MLMSLYLTEENRFELCSILEKTNNFMMLAAYSRHEYYRFREAVALNRNCPEIIKRFLAKDESWAVRYSVAGNCRSKDLLGTLARDISFSVVRRVIDNPNCPEDVLEAISAESSSSMIRTYVKEVLRERRLGKVG
jgi:hypothetical protein